MSQWGIWSLCYWLKANTFANADTCMEVRSHVKDPSVCRKPSTSDDDLRSARHWLHLSVCLASQANPDSVKCCSCGPCRLLPVILINCLESMCYCRPPNPPPHTHAHTPCSCTSSSCYLQKVSAGQAFYCFVVKCVCLPSANGSTLQPFWLALHLLTRYTSPNHPNHP